MPRNNGKIRRTQRKLTARRGALQRLKDSAQHDLLMAVEKIINNAAEQLMPDEVRRQLNHACGDVARCTLHAKACAMLNQNMPPHMIVGRRAS